ncbi:hypothetical protein [Acinetobacter sp. 3657]|uniref:hypothetical protein n=1 Tax=Acinetobacter sp. 3657 TaxID=2817764 RepID=UPI002856F8AF|nr:hypothetical protein [Prolinoborus sp. 3657]
MELSKRTIADRRQEIEKILVMFELKTPEVNGEFITLIRELYSYNCRWQEGEETTEKQNQFLSDYFYNYYFKPDSLYMTHQKLLDYRASYFQNFSVENRTLLHSFYEKKLDYDCFMIAAASFNTWFYQFYESVFRFNSSMKKEDTYNFIKEYRENCLDSLWSVMDEGLEGWKGKFDECFRYTKSVKVICLDLFYLPDNITIRGDNIRQSCLDHYSEFISALDQDTRLLAQFSHLQFGINHNFYVSGAFIFKNDPSQSMSSLKSEIHNLWQSAYCRLGPRDLNSNMGVGVRFSKLPAGIISKNNDKYRDFISITLNYLVNLPQLLVTQISDYQCIHSFGDVGRSHNAKLLESSPSSSPPKPRKPHTPVSSSLVGLTSDFLKGVKLKSVEKKEIKNIQLMYALFLNEFLEITKEELNLLVNLEIFAYLAMTWSQEPFQVNDDGTVHLTNDLGRLSERVVRSLDGFHKILHGLFGRFGWIFSLRVTVSYVVIQQLKSSYREVIGVDLYSVRWRFVQGLRHYFNSSILTFKETVDRLVIQKKILSYDEQLKLTLLHHLFNETQNQQQLLAEYLNAQKKLKRKAETEYNKYWVITKATKGINILCSFKIHCDDLLNNLHFINETIRKTIDQLMKDESKKIYAYLGGVDILEKNKDISTSKVTLSFSIDAHDIATRQEFIDYVFHKLQRNQMKFNDAQQDSKNHITFEPIVTSFCTTYLSEVLRPRDTSIGESMDVVKVWFYYLSHKSFYLVTLPYDQKKRVIKGLSSYKSRKKKPKSQLKKFEVNTDIGEKSST